MKVLVFMSCSKDSTHCIPDWDSTGDKLGSTAEANKGEMLKEDIE